MVVKLPYGRGTITCDVRGLAVAELKPRKPKRLEPPSALVTAALQNPVGNMRLAGMASGRGGAVILVPDTTRKAALPVVLPALLTELGQAGIPPERVTVLVACGTHPPSPADALREHLGPLPAGVRVVQHDARDPGQLVQVGQLPDGTPVRLNRLAAEAPLLVSVFSVQHHYFAGFGGGPKMIFPGVAGYEEVQRNHSRVLDLSCEPPRLHPRCQPGVLEGNPVAEEIAAAAALRPADWSVGLVLHGSGEPFWVGAGEPHGVWRGAIACVREHFEVAGGPFRKILVSAGGYPTDATLIQAHKAMEAAGRFLAEGGEMLVVAELSQGAGSPAMEPFLAQPEPEALAARLRREYVQYGHTTWRLVNKARRFRLWLFSQLDERVVRRLGMHPVAHPQQVLDHWRDEGGRDTVALMVSELVYPRVGQDDNTGAPSS